MTGRVVAVLIGLICILIAYEVDLAHHRRQKDVDTTGVGVTIRDEVDQEGSVGVAAGSSSNNLSNSNIGNHTGSGAVSSLSGNTTKEAIPVVPTIFSQDGNNTLPPTLEPEEEPLLHDNMEYSTQITNTTLPSEQEPLLDSSPSGQPKIQAETTLPTDLMNSSETSPPDSVTFTTAPNNSDEGDHLVCDSTGLYCFERIVGEWVNEGSLRRFNAPFCCTWDVTGFEQLQEMCGTERWPDSSMNDTELSTQRYSGKADPNDFPVQMGGHGCSCSQRNFTDLYRWQSPKLLNRFDSHYTCKKLKQRSVLILGDSTGQQFASTLMNALQPAGCAHQLHFALSDTLLHLRKDRGYHWYGEFQRLQPDICIWGVGAHIWEREQFESVLKNVVKNMTSIQAMQKNESESFTHFVYKTQQPAGCSKEISLLSPDEAALDMIRHNHTTQYNHAEYYDRDIFALRFLKDVGMPAIDLRMLYSRGEAHVKPETDCLHFCSPGPLDVVADLFQQLLDDLEE